MKIVITAVCAMLITSSAWAARFDNYRLPAQDDVNRAELNNRIDYDNRVYRPVPEVQLDYNNTTVIADDNNGIDN